MDLSRVVFAHAVNDASRLATALADDECTILEADVLFASLDGTAPATAVMGHDHASFQRQDVHERLSLQRWLELVLAAPTQIGVKIDIKDHAAVPAVLSAVQEYEHAYAESNANDDEAEAQASVAALGDDGVELELQAPRSRARRGRPMLKLYRRGAYFLRPAVLINADVLTATTPQGVRGCTFNAAHSVLPRDAQIEAARAFVEAVGAALPAAIISLGWTTCTCAEDAATPHTCSYTPEAVADMLSVTQALADAGVPFTFAVRASYVIADAPSLAPLVARFPLNSFTVWSPVEVPARAFRPVRALLEPRRTMMDIPPDAEERRARARIARRRTYLFTAFMFAFAACALPTLRKASEGQAAAIGIGELLRDGMQAAAGLLDRLRQRRL